MMTRDNEWAGSFGDRGSDPEVVILTENDLIQVDDERVGEATLESFPASDPPAWTSELARSGRSDPPPIPLE